MSQTALDIIDRLTRRIEALEAELAKRPLPIHPASPTYVTLPTYVAPPPTCLFEHDINRSVFGPGFGCK